MGGPHQPRLHGSAKGFAMLTLLPIRPALQSLRQMPTLHEVSEVWGKLELKLETTDTRYWLTTEGVPQKTTGTPINYVIDYVTVEKLTEDGRWDLRAVYSPEAWKLSQGFDYRQLLHQEIEQLIRASTRSSAGTRNGNWSRCSANWN